MPDVVMTFDHKTLRLLEEFYLQLSCEYRTDYRYKGNLTVVKLKKLAVKKGRFSLRKTLNNEIICISVALLKRAKLVPGTSAMTNGRL